MRGIVALGLMVLAMGCAERQVGPTTLLVQQNFDRAVEDCSASRAVGKLPSQVAYQGCWNAAFDIYTADMGYAYPDLARDVKSALMEVARRVDSGQMTPEQAALVYADVERQANVIGVGRARAEAERREALREAMHRMVVGARISSR